MAQRGKKYQESSKLIDKERRYSPGEAVELAQKACYAKFDEMVELHIRMGVNPRASDQQVRGIASLPHGLGKTVRVLVFAQGEAVKLSTEAGADYAGADDIIKKIEDGWLDFDVAIATPDMMPKVAKLGRILGRRGLMPNPKASTVVPPEDLSRAISEVRQGKVEFRLDRTAIIHLPLGKASFDKDKLLENLGAIMEAVLKAKPAGLKGQYIAAISLCTSMGPGIKLDLGATLALAG